MKLSKKFFEYFYSQLMNWHGGIDRQFPWQQTSDPYLIWVSEVFLQQTQADRVVEFFIRFTSRYPTVQDLSKATFEEALTYYRGLGYYGRLRRMLELSKVVVSQYEGEFPKTEKELVALPGVGQYTARAIMGFAFGKKVIAPDTNVVRVLARCFMELTVPQNKTSSKAISLRGKTLNLTRKNAESDHQRRWMSQHLDQFDFLYDFIYSSSAANLNQMLMDFGNLVCDAKKPKCEECVLQKQCQFNLSGGLKVLEQELIERRQKRNQRSLRGYQKVVCGVVVKNKKILVSRRKEDQTYVGLLEFPGGKVEEGENLRSALQRELMEELGVEVAVRPPFRRVIVDHREKSQKPSPKTAKGRVLSFHRCSILKGEVKPLEGQEILWLSPAEMDSNEFIPLDIEVVEEIKKRKFHLY